MEFMKEILEKHEYNTDTMKVKLPLSSTILRGQIDEKSYELFEWCDSTTP